MNIYQISDSYLNVQLLNQYIISMTTKYRYFRRHYVHHYAIVAVLLIQL